MKVLPKDVDDLMLAPVALQLEDRLVELGALGPDELPFRLALDSNLPSWDVGRRTDQVLTSVARDIELHGWELHWDARGLRLRHGLHSLVLGVPAALRDYVSGVSGSAAVGPPNR